MQPRVNVLAGVTHLILSSVALRALLRENKLREQTPVGQAALKVGQAQGVVVGLT
jgi:hypothetical protein